VSGTMIVGVFMFSQVHKTMFIRPSVKVVE
jgi:hypothetical protein